MENRKGIRELTGEEIQMVTGATPLLLLPLSQVSWIVKGGMSIMSGISGFGIGHTFNTQLSSYGLGTRSGGGYNSGFGGGYGI